MPAKILEERLQTEFTHKLMEWHLRYNKRIMPWKGEKDPYKIWISEIILQQTRVEQGVAYYDKFVRRFPTVEALAGADDAEVFKLWEGLGYYSRCRNVIFSARQIVNLPERSFPQTYEDILSLKGIGPYTAAAIASFAYGLPHAVLDGNVFRVLARYFGETVAIDSNRGKQFFTKLAHALLYTPDAGSYNQAIMDFGATICKPQLPQCTECMLQTGCVAYNTGRVTKLPLKEKKIIKTKRWFYYFVFLVGDEVILKKRTEKDIWQGLHEFYLFETNKGYNWSGRQVSSWLNNMLGIKNFILKGISSLQKQQLTHQYLQGQFLLVRIDNIPFSLKHMQTVQLSQLHRFAFPKFINEYLKTRPLEHVDA